ncbi:MAG: hypothetical protein RXQ22_06040 [Sulfolobus sp.]
MVRIKFFRFKSLLSLVPNEKYGRPTLLQKGFSEELYTLCDRGNPEVQLLKGTISNELKEDICSTSEEEIKTLIDETCEFIVGVKLPEEKKEKVIDVVKQICS